MNLGNGMYSYLSILTSELSIFEKEYNSMWKILNKTKETSYFSLIDLIQEF